MQRNPENYAYHRGYQCALLDMPQHLFLKACGTPGTAQELNAEQVELLSGEYAAFRAAQPRCRAHRRIPLDFLPASDPRFRAALDTVLRRDLRKGMPSLFMHLKSLYSQPGKAEVIGELVEGCVQESPLGWGMSHVRRGEAAMISPAMPLPQRARWTRTDTLRRWRLDAACLLPRVRHPTLRRRTRRTRRL